MDEDAIITMTPEGIKKNDVHELSLVILFLANYYINAPRNDIPSLSASVADVTQLSLEQIQEVAMESITLAREIIVDNLNDDMTIRMTVASPPGNENKKLMMIEFTME